MILMGICHHQTNMAKACHAVGLVVTENKYVTPKLTDYVFFGP